MSEIIAPVVAPAPGDAPDASHLPSGAKVDSKYDASEFFDRKKPDAPAAPPPSSTATPPPTTKADPKAPVSAIANKLQKKEAPPAPPPAAGPTTIEHPEDKMELDAKAHASTKDQFKQLKTITKGLRDQLVARDQEVTKVKKQLEDLPKITSDTPPEEVVRLRQEHKSFSDRLMVLDLRNHPDFQKQYLLPKEQALGGAAELLKGAGIADVDVARLVNLPRAEFGKAVSEAAAKLPDFDKVDFAEQMRRAYGLAQGEREAVGKAQDTLSAMRQQGRERHVTTFNRVWNKVGSQIGEHAVKLDVPDGASLEERKSIESYNAAIEGLQGSAQKIAVGEMGEEEIAASAIKAAAYDLHTQHVLPRVLQDYEKLAQYAQELHAELEALRGRNPNKDQIHAGSPGAGVKPEDMDHHEAADHYYSRQGQAGH